MKTEVEIRAKIAELEEKDRINVDTWGGTANEDCIITLKWVLIDKKGGEPA